MMDVNKMIQGKRILIVDDEKDVLDVLVELLETCKIDTAQSFEEGKRLLEENEYDVAILDIMGVKGFDLLAVAKKQGAPALMLTAHALTEENLKKSAEEGAFYYAPKEEINKIDLFVADIIEAKEKKKNVWVKWFARLGGYYDKRFTGPNWREKEREFWDKQLTEYPRV
jgi:DNA-binding NtrC family response regulator